MTDYTPRLPRLLVVEDDEGMAELLARLGRKAGCEARTLLDTATLSEVLRAWSPDIVSLDLIMPRSDTVAVLDCMRDAGFCGKLMIVSGQREALLSVAAAHAARAGLDLVACVAKPVEPSEFCALVSRTIMALPSRKATALN